MYFHEYFVDFDGDFGAFDESGSYNFVPNKRPPFSLFSKRPGRLKGRIRYVWHYSQTFGRISSVQQQKK